MNLYELWKITPEELSQAIIENPSLRGMVFGYVAEVKLREYIDSNPSVEWSKKDDDHDRKKKGDRRFSYRGEEFTIESKSLQTKTVKRIENLILDEINFIGSSQVDGSDRRKIEMPDGQFLETTLLRVGEFDIVSINCFAFMNEWLFLFARNIDLPKSKAYSAEYNQHLLASLVKIEYPIPKNSIFRTDLFSLLDEIILDRTRKSMLNIEDKDFLIVEKDGRTITAEE